MSSPPDKPPQDGAKKIMGFGFDGRVWYNVYNDVTASQHSKFLFHNPSLPLTHSTFLPCDSACPCTAEQSMKSIHTMQDSPPSKKRKKKGKRSCYHCNSFTHWAKVCPHAICAICLKKGHDAGGCPTKAAPPVEMGEFHARGKGVRYIELFAGMGGFRVALDRLGAVCVFASEVDRFCRKNYQDNFGDQPAGDICRIASKDIPDHDLLVGGFPCQPFSNSGKKLGLEDPSGRGLLFREIVRILKDKRPKAFLLENVRGLYLSPNLQLVVQELESCGYKISSDLIDAVKILPQERCRLFIVGIRQDLNNAPGATQFKFPVFPDIRRGVQDILHDNNHLTTSETERLTLNPNQMKKVRAQRYTQEHPEARFLSDPETPTKTIQSSYTKYMVGSQFVPVTFGDNTKWRRFSSREVARLQGFPESIKLCPDRAYHMVGNAVAPPVVMMLAVPLLQHIHAIEDDSQNSNLAWRATQEILLEATPADHRRSELKKILDTVEL